MKFRKLKKKMAEYDISWDGAIGKGSHGAFVGRSHKTKARQTHVLPKSQQDEVHSNYIGPLRRAFELTPEHGVSDKEFFS